MLGRGVGWSAIRHADFRELRIARTCVRSFDQFRESEVKHFHRSSTRDHHVSRFDVTMRDAATVRRRERVSYLNLDRERATQVEWLAANELAHVASLDVLHRDEVDVEIGRASCRAR